MNIKAYIDYFGEISELERSQQFTLLERSESHANSRFQLPIFKLVATLVPISVMAIFISVGYLLLALPMWAWFIVIVVALLISRVIVSELNVRLLHTSLVIVLKQNERSQNG